MHRKREQIPGAERTKIKCREMSFQDRKRRGSMKKTAGFLLTVAILMTLFSLKVFAGEWKNYFGVWRYAVTEDGSLEIGSGWHEIDGKQYYFYDQNRALKNSVTPDGYVVGEDCAWVKDAPLSSVKCAKTFLIPDTVTTVPAAGKIKARKISCAFPPRNQNGTYSGNPEITIDGSTTIIPAEEGSSGYRVWAADLNPVDDCENLLIEILMEDDSSRLQVFSIMGNTPVPVIEVAGVLNDFEPAGDGTLTVYRFDPWGVHSFGSFGRRQKILVDGLTAKMTESRAGTMRFDTFSFGEDYVCTARKKIVLTDREEKNVTGSIAPGDMFLITEAWDSDTGNGDVWYRIKSIADRSITGWNRHLIDADNPLIEGTGYFEETGEEETETVSEKEKRGAIMTDEGMRFTFDALPKTREELEALPEAALLTPFQTAALTVAALCHYGENVEETLDMIRYLKGPNPLSVYETQFLRDRLGGKDYVPRSFFAGTSPDNSYTPDVPYVITVEEDPYTYAQDGYAKLLIHSSGADSSRPVKLVNKDGRWYLWENMLLSDIRKPE
jgi:hypothetical protein